MDHVYSTRLRVALLAVALAGSWMMVVAAVELAALFLR